MDASQKNSPPKPTQDAFHAASCSPSDMANALRHAADDHPCCKDTLQSASKILENMPKDFTLEDMEAKLDEWMVKLWGKSPNTLEPEQREQWHRDNGLIRHFIRDHFQPKIKP